MVKQEDPELLQSTETPGSCYIYITNAENDLKIGRRNLSQLVIESHIKKNKRDRDMVGNQTPSMTNYKQEDHHKHRKARGSEPTPGMSSTGDPH